MMWNEGQPSNSQWQCLHAIFWIRSISTYILIRTFSIKEPSTPVVQQQHPDVWHGHREIISVPSKENEIFLFLCIAISSAFFFFYYASPQSMDSHLCIPRQASWGRNAMRSTYGKCRCRHLLKNAAKMPAGLIIALNVNRCLNNVTRIGILPTSKRFTIWSHGGEYHRTVVHVNIVTDFSTLAICCHK